MFWGVFLIVILWGIIVQKVYLWNGQPVDAGLMTRLSERNSILINILSLGLFILFINKKPFYNSKINFISKSVFSLYLFHCHPSIKNEYIWSIVKYADFYDSIWFGLYTIVLPIIFLVIVLILDIPGRIIFEKIVNNQQLGKLAQKIDCWLDLENNNRREIV